MTLNEDKYQNLSGYFEIGHFHNFPSACCWDLYVCR